MISDQSIGRAVLILRPIVDGSGVGLHEVVILEPRVEIVDDVALVGDRAEEPIDRGVIVEVEVKI